MLKKFTKDQILVLIGACLSQCALLGILVNCVSVLLAAVQNDMGMAMTQISSYHTLKSLATAASAAFLSALFFRMNKGVFMGLCIGGVVLGHLLLVINPTGILWWVSALVIGVSFSTCGICVPVILGQWFPKNAGFATGIALAFSGIGGVLFNPIASKLITAYGWRSAIVIMSIVTAAIAIPGVVLAFGKKPPVTEEEAPAAAKQMQQSTRTGVDESLAKKLFPLCQLSLASGTIVVMFYNYISSYATGLGYSLEVGATMASMVMAGNVLGKLIFGAACDKFGVWKSMQVNFLVLVGSMLCFLLLDNMLPALYLASLLLGSVYGINMIAVSRGCVQAYGQEGSKKYIGTHTAINSGLGTACSFLVGPLYDATGSFTALLIINVVMLVLSFTSVTAIRKLTKA